MKKEIHIEIEDNKNRTKRKIYRCSAKDVCKNAWVVYWSKGGGRRMKNEIILTFETKENRTNVTTNINDCTIIEALLGTIELIKEIAIITGMPIQDIVTSISDSIEALEREKKW